MAAAATGARTGRVEVSDGYEPIRSPIRWVGGKSRIRKVLAEMLPEHECFVEVFGGAAWLLFGKAPSSVEVLNDIDAELINFFQVVKRDPQALIQEFAFELVSRRRFEQFRAMSSVAVSRLNRVQRAHRFYYLLMASWGGEFGKPRFQTSIVDRGHGNRLIGAIKALEQRIIPVYDRLRTVVVECSEWSDCIDRYDDPRTVMYLDPPYADNRCHYEHNMSSATDHALLVKRLRRIKSKFILSGYDTPEFRFLCKGFRLYQVDFASGMPPLPGSSKGGRSRNVELLVTNFTPHPRPSLRPAIRKIG